MKEKNEAAAELGRLSQKKKPLTKERASEMGKRGAKIRWEREKRRKIAQFRG